MKPKHTPGPWKVEDDYTVVIPNKKYKLAPTRVEILSGDSVAESSADARLIATSPELLTVLRHLANYCRNYLALDDEAEAIVKDAFSAIAKAEGK